MISSKSQMLKVIATTAASYSLTREEKFQVFVNVCDNMLAEGRITKANHTRWTHIFWITMNYTLKDHLQRVNELIEKYGEDAHCAAWIFTAENCIVYYEDTEEYHFVAEGNSELAKRILTNVADDDEIFSKIQECVDEITEEQYMLYQQELVEV